jgi:hypothetical protein
MWTRKKKEKDTIVNIKSDNKGGNMKSSVVYNKLKTIGSDKNRLETKPLEYAKNRHSLISNNVDALTICP